MTRILGLDVVDVRFPTSRDRAGSDAMNPDPDYSAAYLVLRTEDPELAGYSLVFTTGRGNEVACAALRALRPFVVGRDVSALLADLGDFGRELTSDGQLRWLGPEKGVMHMAIGGVVNAAWDLRARRDGQPLWQVLVELSPEELVELVDFSYIDDVLPPDRALDLLRSMADGRADRVRTVLAEGLPAYTTSAGWLGYDDDKVDRLVREAVAAGFAMVKLKVGRDLDDDVRRLKVARAAAGEGVQIALDANQRWGIGAGHRLDAEAGGVRSVLDGGAHLAGRRARPPGDPGRRRADPDRHRRARAEPGRLQAAAAGRRHRRRADRRLPGRRRQREPGHPAAGRAVRGAGLPARRRGRPVRDGPAPGDVRLRRGERHPAGPVVEYVDHLHEHFAEPVRVERRALPRPARAGGGARLLDDVDRGSSRSPTDRRGRSGQP